MSRFLNRNLEHPKVQNKHKNFLIRSLGRCIGNVVMHKLLLEYTNKPESKGFIKNEIKEYSSDAFEKAQEFNWNVEDKEEIKELAIERVKNLSEGYKDVVYTDEKMEKFIDETIEEMML
ncbi:MAG: hypothetical protein AABY05_02255 [Nanoarchaeota archaeon]